MAEPLAWAVDDDKLFIAPPALVFAEELEGAVGGAVIGHKEAPAGKLLGLDGVELIGKELGAVIGPHQDRYTWDQASNLHLRPLRCLWVK